MVELAALEPGQCYDEMSAGLVEDIAAPTFRVLPRDCAQPHQVEFRDTVQRSRPGQ